MNAQQANYKPRWLGRKAADKRARQIKQHINALGIKPGVNPF